MHRDTHHHNTTHSMVFSEAYSFLPSRKESRLMTGKIIVVTFSVFYALRTVLIFSCSVSRGRILRATSIAHLTPTMKLIDLVGHLRKLPSKAFNLLVKLQFRSDRSVRWWGEWWEGKKWEGGMEVSLQFNPSFCSLCCLCICDGDAWLQKACTDIVCLSVAAVISVTGGIKSLAVDMVWRKNRWRETWQKATKLWMPILSVKN